MDSIFTRDRRERWPRRLRTLRFGLYVKTRIFLRAGAPRPWPRRAAVGDAVGVARGEDARLEARALLLVQAVDQDALTLARRGTACPEGDHGVVGHVPQSSTIDERRRTLAGVLRHVQPRRSTGAIPPNRRVKGGCHSIYDWRMPALRARALAFALGATALAAAPSVGAWRGAGRWRRPARLDGGHRAAGRHRPRRWSALGQPQRHVGVPRAGARRRHEAWRRAAAAWVDLAQRLALREAAPA